LSESFDHYARRVMSGEARGVGAAALRAAASVASPVYSMAMRGRNAMFNAGIGVRRLARPVVGVGNLTTGGTGKTPVAAWLCERLREAGHRPAVLMRGYKARAGEAGDEQAMLRQLLGPGAIVHVDSNRHAGGLAVLREHPDVSVFVLDDGFQHRRLARDFDLVLIDAVNPFGYGRVLPRGMLREPLSGLGRADALLITRADLVSEVDVGPIVARVRQYNAQAPIYRCAAKHSGLRGRTGEALPMDYLKGRRFLAFAGIGNPAALERQLRSNPGQLAGARWFGDHHHYSHGDLEALLEAARQTGADVVLTTAKDWVKVAPLLRDGDGPPVMRIELALQFPGEDGARLFEQVRSRLESRQ
jgi:tetraacyldisaccharide 4'-kinase